MATKLFVGKISFNTTEQSLEKLFAEYGKVVSASVATDRDTGRSRGFAFVEMDTQEEANAAIAALDGKTFEDREIVVNIAKPREDRPPRNDSYRSGYQRR